jgi:hypothetical protein
MWPSLVAQERRNPHFYILHKFQAVAYDRRQTV